MHEQKTRESEMGPTSLWSRILFSFVGNYILFLKLGLTDRNMQARIILKVVLTLEIMEFEFQQPFFKEMTYSGLNSLWQKKC